MCSRRKYIPWIVGAAVCAAVAVVYLTTVQTDINGLDDLVDVGEFQNALFLWGIAHPTGYPLYLLVGGVFVHLANLVGINPAAGASLFSLAGALATLALFFAGIVLQTRRTLVAAAFTLVLAAVGAFWMRSIDAEVYTWAFFSSPSPLHLRSFSALAQVRPCFSVSSLHLERVWPTTVSSRSFCPRSCCCSRPKPGT